MKLTRKLSIRRMLALIGVLALSVAGLVGLPATAHAAVACNVTYTASNWGGGNGFTASVTINNTGDPITQWSLRFAFPGSQQVTQGWGATRTESGSEVTAASLSYNGALGTGASTNIGFNGTFSGTNTAPTSFTVNGTACNGGGGGGNQAPTLSLTSPTSGASYAAGAAVPLAATASDPGGAVARVEFLVDGTVVGTDTTGADTTSTYSFSATGLASGSHTAQARAVDNGSPALSTTTAAVSFTVGGTTARSIVPSSTSVSVPEGGTQTVNVRLSAAPTGNVSVTITRTGDASITVSPASVTLGTGNTVRNVHGFITNTANYGVLREPYFTINDTVNGTSVRESDWIDWNRYVDEQSFAVSFRQQLVAAGFDPGVGMLIDTGRNGWGGSARPTGPGPQTNVDTYVDGGRLDRRIHLGNWCNQAGAGIGERPRSAPATGIDAYVWIKPPGESDGASREIENDEGKSFDRMCGPTYTGNPRNNNHMSRSAARRAAVGPLVLGAAPGAHAQRLPATAVEGSRPKDRMNI